jgi:uncharacterized protein YbjQ (UPF0145 family)
MRIALIWVKEEKECYALSYRFSRLLYLIFYELPFIKYFAMLLTTTPSIEGKPIQEYIGIVTSETIIGANIVKDLFAGIRDIVGGRSGTYERVIEEARMSALQELEAKALRMGANAVVGIDLDFETVGGGGSMLMVVATGTAVKV